MTPSDTYEGLRLFSKSLLQKCMKKERYHESSLVFLTMTCASLEFWSSYFKSWPSNQRGTGWSGSIMTPHDKHIHPRESNFPTPGLTCGQMLTSFGWSPRVELPKSDGCVMVYCRVSPRTLVWSWKFQDFIGSFEASTGCPERWPALDKHGDLFGSDSETGVARHHPLTCLYPLQSWAMQTSYGKSDFAVAFKLWIIWLSHSLLVNSDLIWSGRGRPHIVGRPKSDPNRLF